MLGCNLGGNKQKRDASLSATYPFHSLWIASSFCVQVSIIMKQNWRLKIVSYSSSFIFNILVVKESHLLQVVVVEHLHICAQT